MKITVLVASIILGYSLAPVSIAATVNIGLPTSAGQVQQQMEQQHTKLPEIEDEVDLFDDVLQSVPDDKNAGSKTISIKHIKFNGNKAFNNERLEAIAALDTSSPVTLPQIQAAAIRVTNFYRKSGYLVASTYIPKQDASNGSLTINVVEGLLEGIDIKNDSSISDIRINKTILNSQPKDTPVQKEKLNRSILLVNDLAGIRASQSVLSPGIKEGTTRLGLSVENTPFLQGIVATDNYGNTYTGRVRTSGYFRFNNLFNMGDSLSLSGVLTQHRWSDAFHLGWEVPVGYSGLKLGAAYERTSYRLGNDYKILDAHGIADTFSIKTEYPLVLDPKNKINVGLLYRHDSLSDYMLDTKISKRSVNSFEAYLKGNFIDDLLGTLGLTTWKASLTYGNLKLDEQSLRWDYLSGANTSGRFSVLSASVNRTQKLPFDKWSIQGFVRGQVSNKNLDASAGMSLGGPYGVRGYPSGEAQGDEGFVASVSVNYQPYSWLTLRAFQDYGKVRINHSPYEAGLTSFGNSRTLKSYGVGVDVRHKGFVVNADIAFRQGSKAVGDTDHKPFVWLQASWSF